MKVTPELIKKYHQNRCSSEERLIVEQWLQKEEWGEDIYGTAAGEDDLPESLDFVGKKEWNWKRNLGIAASVLLVLSAGWLGLRQYKTPEIIAMKTVLTEKGEIKELELTDGTRVFLNGESKLEFPEKFADTAREVKLSGEAYFEVSKDPQRKFRIRTEDSEVKVLGTQFNLKAYPGENQELRVSEGKVSFNAHHSRETPQILIARDCAILETSTGVIERRTEKIDVGDHWRDGGLNVDDLSLKDLIPILERRFNVSLKVKNQALLKKHYTGTHKSVTLRAVLDDVGFVLNCNYRISDNTVEIY
jgi:transmembrane sensor